MISGLFSKKKFVDLANRLPEKSSFSGISNLSAKMGLLSFFLTNSSQFTDSKNILFSASSKSEIAEIFHLTKVFFDPDKFNFHFLSSEKIRESQKVEWSILLANPEDCNKKNIFFLTEIDAKLEKFSDIKKLVAKKLQIYKKQKISPLQLFNQLIEIGFQVSPDVNLQKGQYRRSGDIIDVFPVGAEKPIKIEIEFDEVKNIWNFSPRDKKIEKNFQKINIFPAKAIGEKKIFELFSKKDLIITDDIEDFSDLENLSTKTLQFLPFPENEENHFNLRFLSVLKFYSLFDLLSDLREKVRNDFTIFIFSKRITELKNIFLEEKISFSESFLQENDKKGILLINAENLEIIPPSFQNPDKKILFLTDREIFQLRRAKKVKSVQKINLEFLTSSKIGDFVVHIEHGIGQFLGVTENEIDGHIREYLEIAYAGSDRLFVPVDQADKISRFFCNDDNEPKLMRLGSVEWKNIQKKAKKETEKIAKELLKFYAEREQSQKKPFLPDTEKQRKFEATFPYEETPGQMSAICDVKKDMELKKPMDRLVCGDVGFGKTEVAMRAAFKAVESGKQVALVSPVTILTQQHFNSFQKRMKQFDVRIEMISRFKTPAEQKIILENLKKGKIDIIIGTHRLLQSDIKFYDLGLLIVDEEQRFGVQQKEKLKKLRKNIDILTLTATPIPRTLNLALNKLRDISTITTPPPGRLPIITEVRKYSDHLIRDAILKELKRNGQVYFLHNRVQTIEAMAEKLKKLVPEAKIIIGHGQLQPHQLEKRILDFKNGEYDVLISSTIIENGIDLENANTMIVMNSEKFGLSQLYQLRGRIGRSKKQAFAYFLYQTQKLSIEAKKRLRAIVEASELGSGFQISMRDLEIRGAGDILGVSQSGTANVVGVSHFLRLLNQTIREMKEGRKLEKIENEEKDVTIELPVDAFIPSFYISDSKEKILAYQNLAAAKTFSQLKEISEDFSEEFGKIPVPVRNLFKIIELKILARQSNILSVISISNSDKKKEIHFVMGKKISAKEIMNLLKTEDFWVISGNKLKAPLEKFGIHFLDKLQKSLKKLELKNK